MNTDSIINDLLDGNKRFINMKSNFNAASIIKARSISKKQNPRIVIVSCADSRVVPEFIFDQPLGTFLSSRVTGNVSSISSLSVIELGLISFKTPLILVLFHTNCDAVKAACSSEILPKNINIELNQIKIARSMIEASPVNMENKKDFTFEVSKKNAMLSIEYFKKNSDVVNEFYNKNSTRLVVAMYDIETGLVTFY